MNSSSLNILQLASRRLQWLSVKQAVISSNIANADTAGYKARTVRSFDNYLEAVISSGKQTPQPEIIQQANTWSGSLSGNNVILEEQVIKATDTASQYRLASNLYRKANQMILAAAGTR